MRSRIQVSVLKKIFDCFYQVELNDKNIVYPGSGIGLYLVKSLVELHKGHISVESELNVGSRFTIVVPFDKANYSKEEIADIKEKDDSYVTFVKEALQENTEVIEEKTDEKNETTKKYKILVVDDEKLERRGIRFLLKREEGEFQILEAANGKDALGVLASNHVDILFSDVKMPYMNGLELTKAVREDHPEMEIVIFSGYNDFSYAREALRYGVVDYVLKPVDPNEFHKTFQRVMENISSKEEKQKQQNRKEDYLKKYFFLRYLYSGKEEDFVQLEKLTDETEDDVSQFSRMVLVSASNGFFETEEEHFLTSLKEEVQREFYYVNLNSNESIFLFAEKYTDYHVVVEKMYRFFAHQFDSECYFAVSKEIEDRKNLAEEFKALEGMLEEQFYQPHQHLFFHGEKQEEKKADPAEDSEIMEQITNDIQYKDLPHLRQDFQKLEDKYRVNKQFSDMYVKFVFSGILKELLDQMDGMDEKMLSKRVDRLYRCKNLKDVIAIVDEALQEYEHCIQEQEDGFRSEITKVKSYIYHHYQERNLGAETLSAMVFLSPGYLSAVFKEETGVTLNRFIREVRMEKAKELLETTNMKISGIAKEVGFSNNSYFCRSFREFFGDTPEACRKGTEADEKTNTEAAPSI